MQVKIERIRYICFSNMTEQNLQALFFSTYSINEDYLAKKLCTHKFSAPMVENQMIFYAYTIREVYDK